MDFFAAVIPVLAPAAGSLNQSVLLQKSLPHLSFGPVKSFIATRKAETVSPFFLVILK
jgi:hypothetical protein